ncbi:MAG: YkgJ family cysteine cluster protein [Desulfuromonadaceae bacterium]|nr:YkgJ family cysteine cluster protein [Desulfuromonadaceae bacterium]
MFEILKQLFSISSNDEKPQTCCLCCGDCCEAFGGHLHASENDKERWRREGREDLLARINRLDWIWVDPETKQPLERCPFITSIPENRKICAIQDTKPDICRDYPTLAHEKRCLHGFFM